MTLNSCDGRVILPGAGRGGAMPGLHPGLTHTLWGRGLGFCSLNTFPEASSLGARCSDSPPGQLAPTLLSLQLRGHTSLPTGHLPRTPRAPHSRSSEPSIPLWAAPAHTQPLGPLLRVPPPPLAPPSAAPSLLPHAHFRPQIPWNLFLLFPASPHHIPSQPPLSPTLSPSPFAPSPTSPSTSA